MNPKIVELENRILNFFKNQPPIKANNGYSAELQNIRVSLPKNIDDLNQQIQMRYTKGSLMGSVTGNVVIKDPNGQVVSRGNRIKLLDFPIYTDRGTFIVNGVEKTITNQMRLKPGAYTTRKNSKGDVETQIKFDTRLSQEYVPNITMSYNPTGSSVNIQIGGNKSARNTFNAVNFLRALGASDADIAKTLGNGETSDLMFQEAAKKKNQGIAEIYSSFTGRRPSPDMTPEAMRKELQDYFKTKTVFGSGQEAVMDTLGVSKNEASSLSTKLLSNAIGKTIAVGSGIQQPDAKDDVKFKDIYTDIDLILEQIEKDYAKFADGTERELSSSRGAVNARALRPILNFGNGLSNFLTKSSLSASVDGDANPLLMESLHRKVTQVDDEFARTGVKGAKSESQLPLRNLTTSGMNKIDPIETPESDKIGLMQHFALGASVKDKQLKSKVYPVKNGKATMGASHVKELTAEEERNAVVAFFDNQYMTIDGNKISFNKSSVPGRYLDKIDMYPVSRVQYVDTSPNNILGTSAAMIPFVAHDDGSRALMGAAMQKQAVGLVNREKPMVAVATGPTSNETFEDKLGKEYGKPVYSPVDGTISRIADGKIYIKDAQNRSHVLQYYNYYPMNGTFINNELKVKKGDTVRRGQMLAEGWQTKDGALALGANARVAYLPYKGYNYEDGIVISQSFAKKMESEEETEYFIDIPNECKGGIGSKILGQVALYTSNPGLKDLDNDGIIKEGANVKPGQVIAAYLKPVKSDAGFSLDWVRSSTKGGKMTAAIESIPRTSYVEGKVVRRVVVPNPGNNVMQRVILTISSKKPLKLGDKLAGRHGNKGTITKILPDNMMPVAADGKAADLLFSPLAVPSRKNVGQLFEVNAGLIAEKTGKPYLVHNFDKNEKNRVMKDLKKIGIPDGKMKMYLKEENEKGKIVRVPTENSVTVGNMYIMKLKHRVDDKIQARSNSETRLDSRTNAPVKQSHTAQGEKHNPQSIGEMEFRSLIGHGAAWNVLESSTLKSDGGGNVEQRAALFKALQSGKIDQDDLGFSTTPGSLKLMADELKALGLNVKPKSNGKAVKSLDEAFDSLALTPLKTEEFVKTVGEGNEVTKASFFKPSDVDGTGNMKRLEGSLYDPKIFGDKDSVEDSKGKWGYIRLASPVPNPLFVSTNNSDGNIYATVTGMKPNDIRMLIGGKRVMIVDPKNYSGFKNIAPALRQEYIRKAQDTMRQYGLQPGSLVEPKQIETITQAGGILTWEAGGNALASVLSTVDVKQSLKDATKELKKADSTNLAAAYRKYRTFKNLNDNKIEATDLMMTAVPVTPVYTRPVGVQKDTVIDNDLNKLYREIIKKNNVAKKTVGGDFSLPPQEAARGTAMLYNAVSNLVGTTEMKDKKGHAVQGLKEMLGGKTGLIRDKMLSKRQDFSARSVIGVDPNLKIDEIAVPLDIAKTIYKPFVLRELVRQGYAKNQKEALSKWESSDAEVARVLRDIAEDRPVILNRQPSLHKYSMMAMKPVIKQTQDGGVARNIQLNPFVVTGFNADFDGDQMAIHVPITEKAKEEAKTLMRPTNALVNPSSGNLAVEIRHEMALGIYYITTKKPTGTPKQFNSYNDLLNAYMLGKISSSQAVNTPIANGVSAGQALVNWCIPDKFAYLRNFNKSWNQKAIMGVIKKMYTDGEKSGWKLTSTQEIGTVLDKLKNLGFQASTRAGAANIGTSDFMKVESLDKVLQKNLKLAQQKTKDPEQARLMAIQMTQNEADKAVAQKLPASNPLNIMMNSGARAKPQQIRRMTEFIGMSVDVTGKQRPDTMITSSHFSGLAPQEYFELGYDSRKGIFDRSVSTSVPGAMSREIWHAIQDTNITEDDCKTRDYITMKKTDPGIRGRYAADNIVNSQNRVLCKRNQMITDDVRTALDKDPSITYVRVRSPLKCKAAKGVCQKCYGAMPGTLQPAKLGTPAGTLATQAIGEPLSQATMNTFHTGGSNSQATMGIPRLKEVLNLSKDLQAGGGVATCNGTVTKIQSGKHRTIVTIDKKKHIISHPNQGPIELRVKVGDNVRQGEFLTKGTIKDLQMAIETDNNAGIRYVAPKVFFENYRQSVGDAKATSAAQDYINLTLQQAAASTVGKNTVDRRHTELLAKKMTSQATIINPGNSPFTKGQVADRNELDRWNNTHALNSRGTAVSTKDVHAMVGQLAGQDYSDNLGIIVKRGEKITSDKAMRLSRSKHRKITVLPAPIQYSTNLGTISTLPTTGSDNWFSQVGFQDVGKTLATGAAFGKEDQLDDVRGQIMAGKLPSIGTGFKYSRKERNTIPSKMFNFFSKKTK